MKILINLILISPFPHIPDAPQVFLTRGHAVQQAKASPSRDQARKGSLSSSDVSHPNNLFSFDCQVCPWVAIVGLGGSSKISITEGNVRRTEMVVDCVVLDGGLFA